MKKNIVIVIVVLIALFGVYKWFNGGGEPGGSDIWVDNKISASFQAGTIDEKISGCPERAEIFIDASGSMKPYFMAEECGMVNTLSEINNLNINGTKIYFLGSKKPYKGLIRNILGEIEKQPSMVATTFHEFFKESVCRLDSVNELVYLVTDGIMSVGGGDMSKALVQLRGEITNALTGHPDLAAAILRYEGGYKGDYWNSRNQRITAQKCPLLKEEIKRPFFVIALGRKGAIRWLHSLPANKLNYPMSFFMGIHDMEGHMKSILSSGDKAVLEDMNKDVVLLLELPECLKDIDEKQVKVYNAGNELNIPVVKEGTVLTAQIATSVPLRPESDGRIKISFILKNKIPANWTDAWSNENDLNGPDETTTYGLKYLVEGMYNGIENSENMFVVNFIYKRQ